MTKLGVTAAAALLTLVVSAQTKPGAQQAESPRTAPREAAQPNAIKPAASPAAQRALIDRYCVTCHNDRARRRIFPFKT